MQIGADDGRAAESVIEEILNPTNFHRWLKSPPTHPLNPINPDNARILRITAAAGTELADAYS